MLSKTSRHVLPSQSASHVFSAPNWRWSYILKQTQPKAFFKQSCYCQQLTGNMKLCVFFAFLLIAQLVESIDLQVQPLKAIKQAPKVLLPASDYLSLTYYLNNCPGVEGIIQEKVKAWFRKDYTLAASIIRLHFHDCAVRVSIIRKLSFKKY